MGITETTHVFLFDAKTLEKWVAQKPVNPLTRHPIIGPITPAPIIKTYLNDLFEHHYDLLALASHNYTRFDGLEATFFKADMLIFSISQKGYVATETYNIFRGYVASLDGTTFFNRSMFFHSFEDLYQLTQYCLNNAITDPIMEKGMDYVIAHTDEALSLLNSEGQNLIWYALERGNEDMVCCFLQRSPCLDATLSHTNEQGESLMDIALRQGQGQTVFLLLELGVSPQSRDPKKGSILHKAVHYNQGSILEAFFNEGIRVDVNGKDGDGRTPLHIAAQYNLFPLINLLLQNGANPHVCDSNQQTPLHIAATYGHVDCIRGLCQVSQVDAIDFYGQTPLFWSIGRGYYESSRVLIEKGASLNARDHQGYSLRDWARYSRRRSVFRLLDNVERTRIQ